MGKTDPIIIPFYKKHIVPQSPTALLGFVNNNIFAGDLYDISLGNWDINDLDERELSKKYKTIICTRCAYFSKFPESFIQFCHNGLEEDGMLYVDWGFGDHWRFDNFKVGWTKDGETEYGGNPDYKLHSAIWDDSFLNNKECRFFVKEIQRFGYNDLKSAVFDEVFAVLLIDTVRELFDVEYEILTTTNPFLQMYVLLKAKKK